MGFETTESRTDFPDGTAAEPLCRFDVHVLFTDIPSTLSALRTAAQLCLGRGSRIRLLLLETVPYPLPIDKPRRDAQFLGRRFRTVFEDYTAENAWRRIDAVAEIVLCREVCEALRQRLGPGAVVVIGKRSGWWSSKEDGWAKELRRAGYRVVRTSAPAPAGLAGRFAKGLVHARPA